MFKPLLLAAALAAALPSQAITFEGAATTGATVVTDYSALGLVSFDLDLANFAPATLSWRIDDEDLLAPIAFNAVIRNLTGAGLPGLTLTLDRSAFASVGSVSRSFGGSTAVSGSGASRTLSFAPAEFLDLALGSALSPVGTQDWTLATTGFQVGDRFSLTVSPVPEPGTYALLLGGLIGIAALVRRQRPR